MRNSVWFELLRIPTSFVIGVVRENVGMKTVPPWHLIVLGILFFGAYRLTKFNGFMLCGVPVILGFVIAYVNLGIQYLKGEPIAPDEEGESFLKELPEVWQKIAEPLIPIILGVVALFFLHQWILSGWMIFAGICIALVENRTIARAALQFSPIQWWIGKPPELTQTRIVLAVAIAAAADLIQIPITVFEDFFGLLIPGAIADFVLDFITMVLTILLLGFHKLLLPSFLAEAAPELDALPTWTGCVAFVIWQRKKQEDSDSPSVKPKPAKPAPSPSRAKAASADLSVEAQLLRLNDLLRKGLITKDEYDDKRQDVLDSI